MGKTNTKFVAKKNLKKNSFKAKSSKTLFVQEPKNFVCHKGDRKQFKLAMHEHFFVCFINHTFGAPKSKQ